MCKKIEKLLKSDNDIDIQTVLDISSAYFDIPIKRANLNIIEKIDKVTKLKRLIKEYIDSNNSIENSELLKENLKKIDSKIIDDLYQNIYIGKSSNISSLSFRMELHKRWKVIKLIEDYLLIKKYKNLEEENGNTNESYKVNYLTNDFFTYVKKIDSLECYLIIGPFLKINKKATSENEVAMDKLFNFVDKIIPTNGTYPTKGEYYKLGSEFFSCSEKFAKNKVDSVYRIIENIFKIEINTEKEQQAYFELPNKEDVILGKRHWVFFTMSLIFIGKYHNLGPKNKTVSMFHYHSNNNDNEIHSKLEIEILANKIEHIKYEKIDIENNSNQYLKLITKNKRLDNARNKIADFISGSSFLSTKDRSDIWEVNFTNLVKQVDTSINHMLNKRIVILEEYLNDHWQRYLLKEICLYQDICEWTNTILRGRRVFLYKYDNKQDCLKIAYSSNKSNNKLMSILDKTNKKNKQDREKESIAYRSIYKTNKRSVGYVHYQDKDNNISAPNNEQYFLTEDSNMQSSIAHTLQYNNIPMGVIEIQGDRPYYFRHSNTYKLKQLTTFFADYFYRVNSNKWLKNIIKSASNPKQDEAYRVQCKMLSKLFLSSGAGIWIKNNATNSYILKNFYGVEKIEELIYIEFRASNFKFKDKTSKLSNFIKNREEIKNQEKKSFFENFDFPDKNDHNQPYQKILLDNDLINTFIFAIDDKDGDSRPQAIITIHNKNRDNYNKTWQRDVSHIADFISSAFAIMQSVDEEQKRNNEVFKHDLRTNIGQLNQNSEKITNKIKEPFTTDSNKLKFIDYVVKNDLIPITEEAIDHIIAFGTNTKPAKMVFLDKINKEKDKFLESGRYTRFKEIYNKAFETRENKGLDIVFINNININQSLAVKMRPDHLHRILINIIQNAEKYSSIGTKVITELYEEGNYLILEMINSGKKMSNMLDQFDVFNRGFQGTNFTTNITNKGMGLGLWQVKNLLSIYGNTIHFDYKELKGQNLAKYTITIYFYNYKN